MINMDILHIFVIIIDLFVAGFLLWRVFTPKATLWKKARIVYVYIAGLTLYHATIYVITLFTLNEASLINTWLHPLVILYTINPVLVAIIHWRGGHLL